MRKSHQLNLLDTSLSPQKIIWFLAWPTIVEQLLQSMVQYIDSAMVGSLGATATAAVAATTSTIWLVNGIMNAVAIGFSVQVARSIGAGDHEAARKTIKQAVMSVAIFGIIITGIMQLISSSLPRWIGVETDVLPDAIAYIRIVSSVYLLNMSMVVCSGVIRGSGDTRTPLVFNIMTNIINIVGNYLLIFPTRMITIGTHSFMMPGAGLGVSGAAISTACSIAFSGICLVLVLFIKKGPTKISWSSPWKFDKTTMKYVLILGLPYALERITLSLGQIALTKFVTGLGTAALAAHFLAINAESITYLPGSGFATAATTLVAQSLGAKNPTLAKRYGKLCIIYGTVLMSFAGLLLFLFARPLMSLFTPDAQVVEMGATVLRVVAISEPFFGVMLLISGVLRGAGDTKAPFFISLIGMWLIRIPLAWVIVKFTSWGLAGVWGAMVIDLVVRGIMSLVRYRKGTWIKAWTELPEQAPQTP